MARPDRANDNVSGQSYLVDQKSFQPSLSIQSAEAPCTPQAQLDKLRLKVQEARARVCKHVW